VTYDDVYILLKSCDLIPVTMLILVKYVPG